MLLRVQDPAHLDHLGQNLINGVNVSKLIFGIPKGFVIKISEKCTDIYEIAVEEGKFALTEDIEQNSNIVNCKWKNRINRE